MGIQPHSCAPVFSDQSAKGIDLSMLMFEATTADCLSFAAPAPVDAPPDAEGGAQITPEQLAAIAGDKAVALADRPQLTAAPRGVGLTGLPSYFWLASEPRPVVATASAGGMTVTAEARPVQYGWDFGDGNRRTTGYPGRAWSPRRPGNIAHMYESRGLRTVAVIVMWEARWRVNGGPWQPLGYFSNSDALDYPVRQVRSVLVRSRR
ncbi:MAG: PKD domain-containing protein [Actinomycetota bacterium]